MTLAPNPPPRAVSPEREAVENLLRARAFDLRLWWRALTASPLLVFGLCLGLPNLYAALIYGPNPASLGSEVQVHIYLNTLCNAAVAFRAVQVARFRRNRLARIASATALIHGLLILWVVGFRFYYSRPLLFSSLLVSIALVAVVFQVADRRAKRVAVITGNPQQESLTWLGHSFELLSSRQQELTDFDAIVIDLERPLPAEMNELITRAMLSGKDVWHLGEYVERLRGRVSVDHFMPSDVDRRSLVTYRRIKRATDFVLALALAPPVLLLLGFAAIAIKFADKGPIFYRQPRIGLGGRSFTIWKLRTMRPSAEVSATTVSDMRVTPLGLWLRRYRIDELPQIWNVLRGDMSFIGPRPEQPTLAERYEVELPKFAYRVLARPGISGWAQVNSGYAADLAESRTKLSYDFYYIKNQCLTLDVQIFIRTVSTLLLGRGAR